MKGRFASALRLPVSTDLARLPKKLIVTTHNYNRGGRRQLPEQIVGLLEAKFCLQSALKLRVARLKAVVNKAQHVQQVPQPVVKWADSTVGGAQGKFWPLERTALRPLSAAKTNQLPFTLAPEPIFKGIFLR